MRQQGNIILPFVSVVIPTYNRKHSVLRAIQSVLSQTYKNFEIIVVDDASSDETALLVKEAGDHRVRFFSMEKNCGGAFCRNYGVSVAGGDLIAFLDSDDVWLPEKLEKQIDQWLQLGEDDRALFFGYTSVIVKKNGLSPYSNPTKEIGSRSIADYVFCGENIVQTSTFLISRPLILKYPFRLLKKHQDWNLLFELARAGIAFNFVNEPLVEWIQDQPQRVSNNFNMDFSVAWYKESVPNWEATEVCFFRLAIFPFLIRQNQLDVISALRKSAAARLIVIHYFLYVASLVYKKMRALICVDTFHVKNKRRA